MKFGVPGIPGEGKPGAVPGIRGVGKPGAVPGIRGEGKPGAVPGIRGVGNLGGIGMVGGVKAGGCGIPGISGGPGTCWDRLSETVNPSTSNANIPASAARTPMGEDMGVSGQRERRKPQEEE
jgi:hypothetical protein